MNSFLRKLGWLTGRTDKETELCEELQFHLEEAAEQRQGDGLDWRSASVGLRRCSARSTQC